MIIPDSLFRRIFISVVFTLEFISSNRGRCRYGSFPDYNCRTKVVPTNCPLDLFVRFPSLNGTRPLGAAVRLSRGSASSVAGLAGVFTVYAWCLNPRPMGAAVTHILTEAGGEDESAAREMSTVAVGSSAPLLLLLHDSTAPLRFLIGSSAPLWLSFPS